MIERRANAVSRSVSRQCARFGCTAAATATFTFDSTARTVWLDTPFEGNARAGELCGRHARALTPPVGWRVEDRRESGTRRAPAPAPAPLELSLLEPASPTAPSDGAVGAVLARSTAPSDGVVGGGVGRQLAAGPAGAALEAELRGLLSASTPLLARAFRSSGTV